MVGDDLLFYGRRRGEVLSEEVKLKVKGFVNGKLGLGFLCVVIGLYEFVLLFGL